VACVLFRIYVPMTSLEQQWEEHIGTLGGPVLDDFDMWSVPDSQGPYWNLWHFNPALEPTHSLYSRLSRVGEAGLVFVGLVEVDSPGGVRAHVERARPLVLFCPVVFSMLLLQKKLPKHMVGVVREANGAWHGVSWRGVARCVRNTDRSQTRWFASAEMVVSDLRLFLVACRGDYVTVSFAGGVLGGGALWRGSCVLGGRVGAPSSGRFCASASPRSVSACSRLLVGGLSCAVV
jgi:hypothetical protein